MSEENKLLILWIIFGFVFVAAVDSILYFSIHLIFFATTELGLSYDFLTYFIPTVTVAAYFTTALMIIQRLSYKSGISGIYLLKFPTKKFFTLALLAILLNPITDKLAGLYAEYITTTMNSNISEYLTFHGWMSLGFGLSRWLIIIFLSLLYIKKLNPAEFKN